VKATTGVGRRVSSLDYAVKTRTSPRGSRQRRSDRQRPTRRWRGPAQHPRQLPTPDTVWRLAARLRLRSRETKGGLCGYEAKASRAGHRRSAEAREVGSGGLGRGGGGDSGSGETAHSQEPTRHRPFRTESRAQVGTVLEPRPIPCPPVAPQGREAHRPGHEQSQAGVTTTRLVCALMMYRSLGVPTSCG
jgi:hypothetical protein